jgi:hypothetical protein
MRTAEPGKTTKEIYCILYVTQDTKISFAATDDKVLGLVKFLRVRMRTSTSLLPEGNL